MLEKILSICCFYHLIHLLLSRDLLSFVPYIMSSLDVVPADTVFTPNPHPSVARGAEQDET